ncbi:serine/threonine-protein kinase [Streptomyces sp. NEAU-S7GS2]|uniref:protein kinase domain-containing protein n=1 Tax=Streptomyces sp. NEAU-S7GS2 TaxID=2202000 RepID=UPI00194DBCAE|nr:serine/threonine-protein kinase [Streptomyces sp. NEAU-S7GS2]
MPFPLAHDDPPGLGPYRLLARLGSGGMGTVYLARSPGGRTLALKTMHARIAATTEFRTRFRLEADAARVIGGRYGAQVVEADPLAATPWMATEYVLGPPLDDAVELAGPLPEASVRALGAALCGALGQLHHSDVVHRDLKPSNILVTAHGPKVIDFGIARPEHGLTLTTTGQVPVTPGYGAPEQVLGRRVAAPADVFSLGAVLVHAASGRRAFDGGHIAALQYKVVHDEPDLTGVPEALRPLILPLLAKDPAVRPTPDRIAAAFAPPRGAERAWRRGPVSQAIKERESGIHELTTAVNGATASGQVSRRRLLTGLAAGGVVLAAGGGAAAAWWPRPPKPTEKKVDLFAYPPAVKTPMAHLLNMDNGDLVVGGSLNVLWAVHNLAHNTPAPLPVRDVVVFGVRGGGIAAHNVVDGKRRWAAPGIKAGGRYVSLSDRLLVAVDAKGTLRPPGLSRQHGLPPRQVDDGPEDHRWQGAVDGPQAHPADPLEGQAALRRVGPGDRHGGRPLRHARGLSRRTRILRQVASQRRPLRVRAPRQVQYLHPGDPPGERPVDDRG